ncbi:hypothetical protein D051_0730 [Vibrio parahaemolyticus VPCR-2010]|uniref:hypothetical protein n=1 Tax=Vibrio parahaemolyticus TaxID=670 RepID=UPI00038E50BF|nr:hypothetical protein D051_0730 [Vibrio parahaemolyticus VPCR-2010]
MTLWFFDCYRTDSKKSGESLREDHLVPLLSEDDAAITLKLNTNGLSSGILEEAFAGLVRVHGFTKDELIQRLSLLSEDRPDVIESIWEYITEAQNYKAEKMLSALIKRVNKKCGIN